MLLSVYILTRAKMFLCCYSLPFFTFPSLEIIDSLIIFLSPFHSHTASWH
jgi:hypothetical protein